MHVGAKEFAVSNSPDEAKALVWKKNKKYERRSKSSNKFQCVSPRQENTPTKLGSWWNFGTCESQKGWTCYKPWQSRWYKQVWNCYYKIKQDFNSSDECKFFNSTSKWCYMERQMGGICRRFQKDLWLENMYWKQPRLLVHELKRKTCMRIAKGFWASIVWDD